MKNNLLAVISGRRSIRFQMIWAFIASFFTGTLVSISVPIGLLFEIPISMIVFLATFAVTFSFLTRPTITFMAKLSEGLSVISSGNLHYRIPGVRHDELGRIAEQINAMAEKLDTLIQKERQLEKSKMELITGVSHDLRTPLTSIIGYLELLKEKGYQDEAEYDRFIGNTHSKAQQLRRLIDELFDYTRLTQNGAKLDYAMIDLRELLNQTIVEMQPLARENDMTIAADLPHPPLFIRVDPEQIRRAVDNLLMNALKFSVKPGEIRVSMLVQDKRATIRIENEGNAITKEQEANLFDRFYKVDDSRAHTSNKTIPEGAGLGLSIARSIVKLHGGQMRVRHSEGHFDFGIELPLADAASC